MLNCAGNSNLHRDLTRFGKAFPVSEISRKLKLYNIYYLCIVSIKGPVGGATFFASYG